jgi:hypothetical protein
MDEINSYFENEKYEEIKKIIISNKLSNIDKNSLFYLIIEKNLDNTITDDIFINLIILLIRAKIDIINVNKLINIIKLIDDKNNKNLVIIKLIYDYNILKNILLTIIKNIKKSNGILSNFIENININDILTVKFYDILLDLQKYINSFRNLIIINSYNSLINNNKTTFCINNYEQTVSNEIHDRLILLKNYFEINFLKYMNVNIISITEFNNKNFKERKEYYFKTINIINNYIILVLNTYKLFVKLTDNYNNIFFNNI